MKNAIKLFSVLFLVNGVLFLSCDKNPSSSGNSNGNSGGILPTELSVSDITTTSAKLNWKGTADVYQVVVNGETNSTTTTSYSLNGLAEKTKYTWKVRGIKGKDTSAFAQGEFTTKSSDDPGPLPNGAEIKVTFGSKTWTAGVLAGATDYTPVGYSAFDIEALETANNAPDVYFYANLSGSTTYSATDTNFFPDYAFQYLENVQHMLISVGKNGDTTYYYDWFAYSGTVTVSSYNGGKITGSASLAMYNAYQYYAEENQSPETRNLTVTFTNVPLTPAQKSLLSKGIKPNFSLPFSFKVAKSPIKMNFKSKFINK